MTIPHDPKRAAIIAAAMTAILLSPEGDKLTLAQVYALALEHDADQDWLLRKEAE